MNTLKWKIMIWAIMLPLHYVTGQSLSGNSQMPDPPGQYVDVGGYYLHFNVMGSKGPVMIIEPGAGSWSLQWLEVQKELSNYMTVITYDRAGYGWSDPSPYSRTAENIVSELKTGLDQLGIKGPFVLMGHSFGGLLVKTFVNIYPDQVSSLILADAATEYQFEKLPPTVSMILETGKVRFKDTGTMARKGKLSPTAIPIDSVLNKRYWKAYQISASRPSYYASMYNELDLLPATYSQCTIEQQLSIPVHVITAGNSFSAYESIPGMPIKESNEVWFKLQEEQLGISSLSSQHIIKNASHDLTLTVPEELIDAVKKFLSVN